MESLFI